MTSALIAVALLMWGHVDPGAPKGPVQVPGQIIAISPEIAIQTRRAATFLAAAGPELTIPLRFTAAMLIYLVLNFGALVLFETSDDAWRGVHVWEAPKPLWAALIFATLSTAVYMAALLWQIAPLPRFGLTPAGFAAAALAGGLVFGLGKPRRAPL